MNVYSNIHEESFYSFIFKSEFSFLSVVMQIHSFFSCIFIPK